MRRLFIASVSLCLILCGCSSGEESYPTESRPPSFWEQVETKMEENESRIEEYYEYEASIPEIPLFEKVADDVNFSRFTYYRELRTDILYLECWTGQTVIFTPVIGLDGLPLTYTAWIEMEDNYG